MKRDTIDNLVVAAIVVFSLSSAIIIGLFKAMLLMTATGVLYLLVVVNWEWRNKTWFRVVIAALVVAHAVLITVLNGRVPDGPALGYFLPLVFGDGIVCYAIVAVTAKLFGETDEES